MIKKVKQHLTRFTKRAKRNGMTANPNDRLELLRAECEAAISQKENELKSLRAKLQNIIQLSQESDKLRNPKLEPDKYSNTGLTPAVLNAVACLWRGGLGESDGVSPGQISKYMLAHGFRPQGDNFEISVIVTLKRLAQSRRVEESRDSGKRRYKPKEILGVAAGRPIKQ